MAKESLTEQETT